MIDLIVGEAGKLPVKFERGDAPLLPAIGSVFYHVRDHAGAPMPEFSGVAVTTEATTFATSLDIPAGVNTIASGKFFERRTVIVTYVANGVTYTDRYTYRIIPFLNHSVTPEAVRNFIGVLSSELVDNGIDITNAYMRVGVDVGMETMADALSSGTQKEIAGNDLVLARAVLDVLPSLRQRMAQEETNGVKGFKRAQIDFTGLTAAAQAMLDEAMSTVMEGLTTDPGYTLLIVTQDSDPILGDGGA